MQIEDHRPQVPTSEAGEKYAEEVLGLDRRIAGEDHVFGESPNQCFIVHVPDEADGPWVPLALGRMKAHQALRNISCRK